MLTPETQAEILSLYFAQRMKLRAIARKLGLNRKSVSRVVARRSVAMGIALSTRSSRLDPFKDQIAGLIQKESKIPVGVILQRIRDQGYEGGYTILREWVKAKRVGRTAAKEAFFRMEFAAGQAAQIDWGEFGDVFGDGVDIHCFVMVLCFCRLIYIEFTRSERFEEFIRCHEHAIDYFDRLVPEEFWYDNLPTAVAERVGSIVRFNPRFFAYVGHHHVKPHACNVARGNEKGRVEDGVKYIRSNFWQGRKFQDFDDLCAQATDWRDRIANLREHRATRKIPRLHFEGEERAHLRAANPTPYETDEVLSKQIRPDFHILYETNHYSVPWTLVGSVVTIRVDAGSIRVYYQDRFVTRHDRCYRKHQKPFTQPQHAQGLLEIKPQGKNAGLLNWQIRVLHSYGPPLARYLECLRYSPRSLKNEISRLLALGTVYGEKNLAEAVDSLLKRGSIGIDQVEMTLKRREQSEKSTPRPAPMVLQDEKLTRVPPRIDLRQYDQRLLESLERSRETDPPLPTSPLVSKENLDHGQNLPQYPASQESTRVDSAADDDDSGNASNDGFPSD